MSLFSDEAQERLNSTGFRISLTNMQQQLLIVDTLNILSRTTILDDMVLQGGNAVAGGYGGIRLSNDLDFNCKELFEQSKVEKMNKSLAEGLSSRFKTNVTIKAPKVEKLAAEDENIPVMRWYVKADAEDNRPDIPKVKLKIEAAVMPSITSEIRRYKSPVVKSGGHEPLIAMESAEEIVADKIVSFARESRVVRFRDLWDIAHLRRNANVNTHTVQCYVRSKLATYHVEEDLSELLRGAFGRFQQAGGATSLSMVLRDTVIDDKSAEAVCDSGRIADMVDETTAFMQSVAAFEKPLPPRLLKSLAKHALDTDDDTSLAATDHQRPTASR